MISILRKYSISCNCLFFKWSWIFTLWKYPSPLCFVRLCSFYFSEMWYQVFLWALFSSIAVHVIAAAIAFGTLRKHKFGKWVSVPCWFMSHYEAGTLWNVFEFTWWLEYCRGVKNKSVIACWLYDSLLSCRALSIVLLPSYPHWFWFLPLSSSSFTVLSSLSVCL